MKAIINCGGKGTRLPEVSKYLPKPMVEINGKPLLYWHITNLKNCGINQIYITLHYLPNKIIEYFGDGKKFGVKIFYSLEQKQLGTGGALLPIKDFITENSLILYGDVISEIDFVKILKFHNSKKALLTALVHPSTHPKDSDLVKFDSNSKLLHLSKKPHKFIPKKSYNLAALYMVSPDIIDYLDGPTPFDIAHDLLPRLLDLGKNIFCYNTEEFIMDIGTPERLEEGRKLMKK